MAAHDPRSTADMCVAPFTVNNTRGRIDCMERLIHADDGTFTQQRGAPIGSFWWTHGRRGDVWHVAGSGSDPAT
jgi:hypothetical protein